MYGCQVRKERKEGKGEREGSSRKDKGGEIRTVASVFCNPDA